MTHLDYYDHLALGGGDTEKVDFPGVGIARYIRLPECQETAEIALVVLDEYQKKELGTVMLALLIKYGHQNRVKNFHGYVQSENYGIKRLLNRFGAKMVSSVGSLSLMELDIEAQQERALKILEQSGQLVF